MNRQAIASVAAAGAGLLLAARALRQARAIRFDGRVVLISGGSRGLGLLMAREMGREGARLALLARDKEELERASRELQADGVVVMTVPCDITDRSQAEDAVESVASHFGRLDVLVNDAGTIEVGPVEHMAIEDFEKAMAVHFWGPLYLTRAALPHLRRSRDWSARLVNISSIGGRLAVPHLLPYCASKFALTGLSDGLRAELAKDGIRVTTVLPGLMRTGSPFNAWFKGRHRAEFAWFSVLDALPGVSIDGARAAHQVVDACRYGDPQLAITPHARLAIIADAVIPSFVAQSMRLMNWLLPQPDPAAGTRTKSGWQSPSSWSPSWLTRLGDRAAAANNELPG